MRYAMLEGQRRETTPGLVGDCPGCQKPVLARCGNQRVWHWAHRGTVACEFERERRRPSGIVGGRILFPPNARKSFDATPPVRGISLTS